MNRKNEKEPKNRGRAQLMLALMNYFIFLLFAVCMIVKFHFGSYLVCMFLPIGYIMMAAGFQHECCEERRVSANIGLVFSAIYAVLIFLVYFAQITSVRLEDLNEQAARTNG